MNPVILSLQTGIHHVILFLSIESKDLEKSTIPLGFLWWNYFTLPEKLKKKKKNSNSTGLLVVKLFYISRKTTLILCSLSLLVNRISNYILFTKSDRLRKYITLHKILAKYFNLNLIQFAIKCLIWWVKSLFDSNRIQDMAL